MPEPEPAAQCLHVLEGGTPHATFPAAVQTIGEHVLTF